MTFALWCVVVGGVLVIMALSATVLRRLPISAAMIYLAVGIAISPVGIGLLAVDTISDATFLEHLTEVAVIVSLFTAGLKMRVPLSDRQWRTPLTLATVSMVLTIALVTGFGVFVLGLSLGAAVLLGAVLAPTDPVLAGDVQVREAGDRDSVRFGLTGEAGLNDGMAFPFVMLGLGLLGLHDLGESGWRWWAVDVAWAIVGGLAIGFLFGTCIARFVLYLRRIHREAVGLDNFLALGLIALAYGAAILAHTYGFLAVFAAGLALRRVERRSSEAPPVGSETEGVEDAVHPAKAPSHMAESVLAFNEQIEKLLEVAAVVILGALLVATSPSQEAFMLSVVLFLVIRPVSVLIGLIGSRVVGVRRGLIAWFGVRGVGSLYYLTFAIGHGMPTESARIVSDLVVLTVCVSIVVHGVSVTPFMDWYNSGFGNQDRNATPPEYDESESSG